jgi:5'-nucleotidase
MKTLLLTNDDGILSPGIRHLKEKLSGAYDVYIVAPDRERSAISMALTINQPLRLNRLGEREYSVDGTPADCVNIALQEIMPHWPDFIISGMNEGENLCEDVYFSGTVAGAFTGHLYGIPSMAVSLIAGKGENGVRFNYTEGARLTAQVLEKLLLQKNTKGVYNLNVPTCANEESKIAITYPGLKRYKPTVVKRIDPRDREYYWIGTGAPSSNGDDGTDLHAVNNGNISLSILKYSLIDIDEMKKLVELFDRKQTCKIYFICDRET